MIKNANEMAIGAILVQDKRPIVLRTKKLSKAEINYRVTYKELLEVMRSGHVWRCYLEVVGTAFMIESNPNT